MTQGFYESIKPTNIEDFFNKETISHTKEVICNKNNKIILILSESGNGKTTLARMIGNYMKAKVVEINEITANNIEDIQKAFNNAINNKEDTLFIFDEFNLITNKAQLAFLELFKSVSDNITVILTSTNEKWIAKQVHEKCNVDINIPSPTRQEINNIMTPLINNESLQLNGTTKSLLLDKLEGKNLRECINAVAILLTLGRQIITEVDIEEYIIN